MSHYKTTQLTETTRRAAGQSLPTAPEKRRSALIKAVLIIAIGAFVFMAASTVASV